MDEVELPPHPRPLSNSKRPSRPAVLTRKRTREDYLVDDDLPPSATSSDPALFSGDEATPGLESYQSKRKRKMFSGSWYEHSAKARKEDRRREFKRNVDSGIFMGSESETPSSDSIGSMEEALIQDQATKDEEEDLIPSLSARPWLSIPNAKPGPLFSAKPATSPEHGLVMQTVRHCLDEGLEDVDLASRGLSSLPTEMLELATLTKQTNLVSGMLEHGTSLETHLRLYLPNNSLRTIPVEILDLTNLRILSLRRNELTSVPPGIRRLVNLETLNVSANNLSYLPFEIIELIRFHNLRNLRADPNLWDSTGPFFRGGSELTTFRRPNGPSLCRYPSPTTAHDIPDPPKPRVASLFEMTLRQLHRLQPQNDLNCMMPSASTTVSEGLSDLHMSIQSGQNQCTTCHRLIVQPEVEWTEWWSCASDTSPLTSEADRIRRTPGNQVYRYSFPVRRQKCLASCDGLVNAWVDDGVRSFPVQNDL